MSPSPILGARAEKERVRARLAVVRGRTDWRSIFEMDAVIREWDGRKNGRNW